MSKASELRALADKANNDKDDARVKKLFEDAIFVCTENAKSGMYYSEVNIGTNISEKTRSALVDMLIKEGFSVDNSTYIDLLGVWVVRVVWGEIK